MKEKLVQLKEYIVSFWSKKTKKQKGILLGSIGLVLSLILVIGFLTMSPTYVPLYTNLSLQEVGQIKEELDTRSIPYEIVDGGTTIKVPEEQSEQLLVDLASRGIPNSGNIDYSFFSENSSWGITDNEFNIMKLDAMQTELANLIKGIEGIEDAKVMINLPEESVFINESADEASASIVLHTQFGYEFKENEIESLYHLVSKAVPNLPEENIIIMNQYFEYFDQSLPKTKQDQFTHQQTVKHEIERDLQKRIQQMIGAMVGMENVIVSVTTDIDFTEENRVEELIEPVDLENMEGLPVSIETIHETYTGNPAEGGVVGTGEDDIANYPATTEDDNGDYELIKETVNNEFNRIHRDIVESPYKVRDLGVQVAINRVTGIDEDNNLQLLTQQEENAVEDGINSILNSIITTTIDESTIDEEVDPIDLADKTSIVFQEFTGATTFEEDPQRIIPIWLYVVGGILLITIIILIVLLVKNRRELEEETIVEDLELPKETPVQDISELQETEADIQKKQLEKMAKDNPEDFTKLLRTWISDD